MKPQRGELWHAYFPPLGSTAGHRLAGTVVAVLQSDRHRYGKTVLCVPLTTNRSRERPYGVLILSDARNHLKQDSVAMTWLALAVDQANLREQFGRLQAADLDRIAEMMITLTSL